MLGEPNTTEKERVQRTASERIVMMLEDGIVRIRFSLFSFLFSGGPRERGTKEKRGGEVQRAVYT